MIENDVKLAYVLLYQKIAQNNKYINTVYEQQKND